MRFSIFIIALFLATAAFISSVGGADTDSSAADAKLIMTQCTRCHDSARICAGLGVKDAAQWRATVGRMVSKGAELKGDQIESTAAYLSGLPKGSGPICR